MNDVARAAVVMNAEATAKWGTTNGTCRLSLNHGPDGCSLKTRAYLWFPFLGIII